MIVGESTHIHVHVCYVHVICKQTKQGSNFDCYHYNCDIRYMHYNCIYCRNMYEHVTLN